MHAALGSEHTLKHAGRKPHRRTDRAGMSASGSLRGCGVVRTLFVAPSAFCDGDQLSRPRRRGVHMLKSKTLEIVEI